MASPGAARIREQGPDQLRALVGDWLESLSEEEAIAVLDNRFCDGELCRKLAQSQRLSSLYSVRLRLVEHRATPQGYSLQLVPHLYLADLVRLSVDVRVHPAVRRAIEKQVAFRIAELSPGEKIAAARRCSTQLIRTLMFDPDVRILSALLDNSRVTETDLLMLIGSDRSTGDHLRLIADHRTWGIRYEVRRALVLNRKTPPASAAAQLRYLKKTDLEMIRDRRETSTYLRRCIERMEEKKKSPAPPAERGC